MNRMLLGAFSALLLVAAGVFWWQGRAALDRNAPPPELSEPAEDGDEVAPTGEAPDDLPTDHASKRGPALPEESEASKEQRAFDRLDKDRDGRITVKELLTPRVKAFKKLDVSGDNLLSFDEWAISTRNRLKKLDANGDGGISPTEYAARKKPAKAKPRCKC